MIRPSFSHLSCREVKINLSQTKNHSAEIDFSFGAEKKTLLWCKIKRTPRFDFPLHRLPLTKGSRRTTLGLTFFKAKTYCNSLSGESVCRISAGESCTLRSESKVANDKKLIICIQEKNSRIKSYSRYAPYIFPESGKTPYLIILKMKSSPEAP